MADAGDRYDVRMRSPDRPLPRGYPNWVMPCARRSVTVQVMQGGRLAGEPSSRLPDLILPMLSEGEQLRIGFRTGRRSLVPIIPACAPSEYSAMPRHSASAGDEANTPVTAACKARHRPRLRRRRVASRRTRTGSHPGNRLPGRAVSIISAGASFRPRVTWSTARVRRTPGANVRVLPQIACAAAIRSCRESSHREARLSAASGRA
jgi:hypothetical protein